MLETFNGFRWVRFIFQDILTSFCLLHVAIKRVCFEFLHF